MNARIYTNLFRRQDTLTLVGLFVFSFFIAVISAWSKRHGSGDDGMDMIMIVLVPSFSLGLCLTGAWTRPLQSPATVLLPSLQRTLFRWHITLILTVTLAWAIATHWIEPRIPLIAAGGMSLAIATLPISFMRARTPQSMLNNLLFSMVGLLIGVVAMPAIVRSLETLFLTHPDIIGAVGLTVTVVNLQFARKPKRLASLAWQSIARGQHVRLSRMQAAILKGPSTAKNTSTSKPVWNYLPRGNSLIRWVKAAFEEYPLRAFAIIGPYLVMILVGGNPWGGSTIILIVAMIMFTTMTGVLRSGQLYPISRRRRTTVAYVASVTAFGVNFVSIVGGSMLVGWLVGLWVVLPLPSQPVTAFIIKLTMVVPFMPLMRWGMLRLELSQSFGQLLLFGGLTAIFIIASQSLVLVWGLKVGAIICVTSIIISQFAYYAALRRFYQHSDLLQRGPTQDMIGLT